MATTVYALRNRGLVSTPQRGGIWIAEITDAGRFYLEHGYHPEKPQAAPAVAAPPPPPRFPDDKETRAAEFIKRLSQEGGTIRVPDPDDDTRRQSEAPSASRSAAASYLVDITCCTRGAAT
jgi:hypothetical protein